LLGHLGHEVYFLPFSDFSLTTRHMCLQALFHKHFWKDAIETINLLPAPTESAPPLTERDSLRKLINACCRSNNIEHDKAWRTLYAELYIRDGFSVNARIKNSKATSKLELVAEHGKLGILYAIATEIFKVQGLVNHSIDRQ
jgi:hypothetical protein